MHPKNKISSTGRDLYRRAKALFPGGTQLLSKRPEMFAPDAWPAYYSRAKGVHVWDMDGQKYLDMSIMGIGSAILGYADDEVDGKVIEAIRHGVCSSLNSHEEVALAEALVKLHPWSQQVRFARSGGEAMSVAVRIARAATKRDTIYFSGYHGWTDWYLAANLSSAEALDGQLMPGLEPNGVPRHLQGSSLPFSLTDIDTLKKEIRGKEKQIAAFVLEPARGEHPPLEALKAIRSLASEIGAVLIFDEITSGFRMGAGGIHLTYGVNPDLAVFAKAMANGYAMSAIVGVEKVMQAAQTTFISSTNWTERVGPVAALATLEKYQREAVAEKIVATGKEVKAIWQRNAQKHKLDLKITGIPSLPVFAFQGAEGVTLNTIFTTEMLKVGILGYRVFKPALAHRPEHLAAYEKAVDEIFGLIAKKGAGALEGRPAHTGFARLTKE